MDYGKYVTVEVGECVVAQFSVLHILKKYVAYSGLTCDAFAFLNVASTCHVCRHSLHKPHQFDSPSRFPFFLQGQLRKFFSMIMDRKSLQDIPIFWHCPKLAAVI